GDFDRNFRAIGLGEPGLVFQTRRDRTITGFMGIAVFVELEQFGRKRLAAGVALALLLIDVDSQLSCHGKCFSRIISRDLLVRARSRDLGALVLWMLVGRADKLYPITFAPAALVKRKKLWQDPCRSNRYENRRTPTTTETCGRRLCGQPSRKRSRAGQNPSASRRW